MSNRGYLHPQVNLRMPADKKEQLANLANQHGRSLNQEINAAIEAWLSRHETGETVLSVEERLARLEKLAGLPPEE